MSIADLKARARLLRRDTFALYLVARHPDTPLPAKVLAACVAAYALSPIDLIPDVVPVLGYLDDLVLVPLGIAIAVRMVPKAVLEECRARAAESFREGGPVSRTAAVVVVTVWLLLLALVIVWAVRVLR